VSAPECGVIFQKNFQIARGCSKLGRKVQRLVVESQHMMDYNVSSKKEQRGILAGMLLGVAKREGYNFSMAHRPSQISYLLFKKTLLEQITRKPVSLRERKTLKGDRILSVEPKLIPLSRVLVKKLYPGGVKTITRKFLNVLTPQGIAIWFMDKGGKSFKKKAGRIHALEVTLNTHLSKEANEMIVAYFAEVWGIHWGLSKNQGKYRLRLGTQAGKSVLAFLKPYIHSSMLKKINTSYNKTAAT
jgi:hypothetical protein